MLEVCLCVFVHVYVCFYAAENKGGGEGRWCPHPKPNLLFTSILR